MGGDGGGTEAAVVQLPILSPASSITQQPYAGRLAPRGGGDSGSSSDSPASVMRRDRLPAADASRTTVNVMPNLTGPAMPAITVAGLARAEVPQLEGVADGGPAFGAGALRRSVLGVPAYGVLPPAAAPAYVAPPQPPP